MSAAASGDGPVDSIRGVLDALRGADDGIDACALLTLDGAVIASAWPSDAEAGVHAGAGVDALGATAAALFHAGQDLLRELARGRLEQLMLHGRDGWVIVGDAGDGTTLLAVRARADARLGVVRVAIRHAADRLATLLLPPFPAFS